MSGRGVRGLLEKHCGLSDAHQELVQRAETLHALKSAAFGGLDDAAVWNFLDQKLYRDDERTLGEVKLDAACFSRFNFLTNWGESFDRHKGFIFCRDDGNIHVAVSGPEEARLRCMTVTTVGFKQAVAGFDAWCLALEQGSGCGGG